LHEKCKKKKNLHQKCLSGKTPPIFDSKRNKETEKDKDQDDLRVEEAEGDGNTIASAVF